MRKNCKVYSDGSHYIAITPRKSKRKYYPKKQEELVEVKTDGQSVDFPEVKTRTEIFNDEYKESLKQNKRERKQKLVEKMKPYFNNKEETVAYVERKLNTKKENVIRRRISISRKAYLQQFNYFVTFTYDDKLHTEQSFRKKLTSCIRHSCERKGWEYLGVWERSAEKERLHYHGLFYIPQDSIPGSMFQTNDYNFKSHKRKTITQNTYFVANFGRCEFDEIVSPRDLGSAIAYLLKYIEKTGERVTCSKGVKEFFISDVVEDDVLAPYGVYENKVILADKFICYSNGEYVGKVSPEVIKKLIKNANKK